MKDKIESSLKNMILSLFVISLIAAISLSFMQTITKKPIQDSRNQKKINAIAKVVPEFNNNPVAEMYKMPFADGDSLEVYPARKNDEFVGAAIAAKTNSGFGGEIKVMVGFVPDGTIYNTSVIEHHETPGLGDKMCEQKFADQFKGFNFSKKINKVTKDKGDVDAITAATISSRAYCNAVQNAYNVFQKTSKPDAKSGATY